RFAIAADGIYGPVTTAAVRTLQTVWRLRVTGVVDAATWNHLISTVRVGDRGEKVRAVQALLNIYGRTHTGYRLVTDGIFGPRTRAAVIRLQTAVDITNDGVVNATTWHYLVWAADRVEAAD
ncbi:MAG TPA: peptidoglycan-binding protein, partial [Streptosporangiales bacterium]